MVSDCMFGGIFCSSFPHPLKHHDLNPQFFMLLSFWFYLWASSWLGSPHHDFKLQSVQRSLLRLLAGSPVLGTVSCGTTTHPLPCEKNHNPFHPFLQLYKFFWIPPDPCAPSSFMLSHCTHSKLRQLLLRGEVFYCLSWDLLSRDCKSTLTRPCDFPLPYEHCHHCTLHPGCCPDST